MEAHESSGLRIGVRLERNLGRSASSPLPNHQDPDVPPTIQTIVSGIGQRRSFTE